MNKGIACAGNLIVDVIKEIECYPVPGNLTTITQVSETTGGLVCNCLLDIANMDKSVPLTAVGLAGKDIYADKIVNVLSDAGVDVSLIDRHPTLGTSFTDVMNESNERTFFQYRGANAAFGPQHIPLDKINANILHIGYILLLDTLDSLDPEYGTVMARVLHSAQSKGFKTSIDVVSEQGERFQKLLSPALKYVDYCVINEIEASAITGIASRDKDGGLIYKNMKQLCKALKEYGVREWAVIHCPEGSFAFDKNGLYYEQPSLALPKTEIKGKTGAGDAFCAAMLYGAYKGLEFTESLKLANAAAASCLREKGASEGVLPVAKLWDMIEKYGFRTWSDLK